MEEIALVTIRQALSDCYLIHRHCKLQGDWIKLFTSMICRMMEALRPSVNLTSPESRRPCRVVESEKLAGDVKKSSL